MSQQISPPAASVPDQTSSLAPAPLVEVTDSAHALLPEELPEEQLVLIRAQYRALLRSFKNPLNDEDHRNIRTAFEWAADAHKTQWRKSGEPYITHPIEVARICVEEIGLGPTAVVCALLHDIVEDTAVSNEEIRLRFPDSPAKAGSDPAKTKPRARKSSDDKSDLPPSKIAEIVDGLTKLDGLHRNDNPQAQNIKHVLEAMLNDVRVVLIKLADRLHNLRTIGSMAEEKQRRIAAETEAIYTPLAHQLGLYKIKTEFQDICLKINHRAEYNEVADKLAETKGTREAYIDAFIQPIKDQLQEFDIPAQIFGRPKGIHSIWSKMNKKKVAFENIYDLFAIRVIVGGKELPVNMERILCWQVYAIVTDCYKPIPERQKDWISVPKTNGYESLHITVAGPGGRYVEVQIRTERMDDIAERGFAAHWKYKGVKGFGSKADLFENWLNEVRDSIKNKSDALEYIADFQDTIFVDNAVHVFTPKGEMKILPKGATGLDFAFSIHSDVGCTCQVVRVNGALQPFNYLLQNGDQVQIVTNKNNKPSEDWLQFVVTSKARERIRAALNEEKRQRAANGKEMLARKLNNQHKVGVEENVDMLAKWYGFPNRLEFLDAVSLKQVDLKLLKRFRPDGQVLVLLEPTPRRDTETLPAEGPQTPRPKPVAKSEVIINGDPNTQYAYSFAPCCSPVQGDPIFAYITGRGEGVKIHRYSCLNAQSLLFGHNDRILKADWGNFTRDHFVAGIIVTGTDRGKGVIREISEAIESMGINVREFSMRGESGYFEGQVSLLVSNLDQLTLAMRKLKEFEYVQNVRRAEGQ